MKKVYLAKSNKCNPDHILKVRGILNDSNVETVEYKGGNFSHKAMLECDMLIVLPDLSEYEEGNECVGDLVGVGKGLFEQVEAFKQIKISPIYVVHNCDGWDPNISTLDDDWGDIHDENDYINYGWLNLIKTCDTYENLHQVLEEEFGGLDEDIYYERLSNQEKTNKKYFLLIK